MKKTVPKGVAPVFHKIQEMNTNFGEILRQANEPFRQAYDACFEEVEVPSECENTNESKPLTEPVVRMILKEHRKEVLAEVENAVSHGTRRAMARFQEPLEAELETIIRLKKDKWRWKAIVKYLYPDTPEEDLKSEVEKVKQRYRRAKGKF
jgi:hypothetical protein